ncbi:helix-turn-helix domain-containing protein [Minwuia sp.]|uniref:helix-turn-helix domain-containing protein n=1 Tax=Minwuia sp. TaxID=2493630 RepID=UPI003A95830D
MGDQPHPVDVHVGSRVRLCRTLKGLSQQKLAQTLGLTFQQVQKYERGANRVSASKLFELSQILDVPVAFFFEDIKPDGAAGAESSEGSKDTDNEALDTTKLFRREILELVRAYDKISEPIVRKRIYDLVKSVGPAD